MIRGLGLLGVSYLVVARSRSFLVGASLGGSHTTMSNVSFLLASSAMYSIASALTSSVTASTPFILALSAAISRAGTDESTATTLTYAKGGLGARAVGR